MGILETDHIIHNVINTILCVINYLLTLPKNIYIYYILYILLPVTVKPAKE